MTYVTAETDEKKKQEIPDFYTEFMLKQRSKPQAFNSLDEFKKTDAYENLPEEQQEELEQSKDKKVTIFVFESAEHAMEFIEQAKEKGLFSEEQAEAAIAQVNEQNENSYRPGI